MAANDVPKPSRNAPSLTRRADLVQAARELYEEKGLSKTSVQDIASRVGVTRSLFYHYFPDKDAITSAVLDDYIADFLEAMRYWNAQRQPGNIEHALDTIVRLMRLAVFEDGSFRRALTSRENAALYIDFANRVADALATYLVDTTVRDYGSLHVIRITHLQETFHILILGMVGYLRTHPDADDDALKDIIAQTLHIRRGTHVPPDWQGGATA